MSRYFSSFFIASFFYILFGIAVFYLFINEKIIIIKPEQSKSISLNHIELKPELKPEPKIENKIEEKIEEKPQEKIKKEIIQEIKKESKTQQKIVKVEKTKPKTKPKEKTIATPIKNESVKQKIVQSEIQNIKKSYTPPQKQVVDDKKVYLDNHLSQIRKLINQNVKYPKRARKLSIQGIVTVKFKILENGNIENIVIVNGHEFLQNATIEAIQEASKSFPKVPKNIEIQIPIEYKLI